MTRLLCSLELTYYIKRFCFILGLKIAKFVSLQDIAVETLMLVVYPLPDKGDSISDQAWERTVYRKYGVWRCLRSGIRWNIVPRFLCISNQTLITMLSGGRRLTAVINLYIMNDNSKLVKWKTSTGLAFWGTTIQTSFCL